MCLLATAQAAQQIDPKIYAKIFMNNKPMFDRMATEVLEKLPMDGEVLDLASGPGEPSVTLATLDPQAKIVCTDFQPEMNERARARAEAAGVRNVDFALTSGDDLGQWQESNFDAVTMSFGLMFVPDRAKSLREIHRVLKPGGFAYISVWKELQMQTFAHEILEKVAGKAMPEFTINPLKLKEDNAVEDVAVAAGLEVFADERLSYTFMLGTPTDAADGFAILAGGMLKQLEEEGGTGATQRFYDVVGQEVQKRGWQGLGGEVAIPGNSPQLLTLRKPAKEEL